MIPTFASPIFLGGFAALGVLVAIYLLRMRARRVTVSSLFLWLDEATPDDGGRTVKRLRTPLAFFLELLAISLLVLAAAGPFWFRAGTRTVFVLLDDSYSMQATAPDGDPRSTSRQRAWDAFQECLEDPSVSARVILAGTHPVLLADRFDSVDSLGPVESRWRCLAPGADLTAAIGLARRLDPTAEILVLTDTKPPVAIEGDRLRWIALGNNRPNLAVISAVRKDGPDGGKAVIEMANYSTRKAVGEMAIRLDRQTSTRSLAIEPGEIGRFTLTLPPEAGELEVKLPVDSLSIDNRIWLLPRRPVPLRVELAVENPKLKNALRRAITAAGPHKIITAAPDIRFTDQPREPRDECWNVSFIEGPESKSILGPFLLEKGNRLLDGVTLEGVVLARSSELGLPGIPLVSAGNVPLITWDQQASGQANLFLQWAPDKTTLAESVDFPILIANLLLRRTEALPERFQPNVRIGETVGLRVNRGRENAMIKSPSDETRPLTILPTDEIAFSCDQPGIYSLSLDESEYTIATNVLNRQESDLTKCSSGQWGNWNHATGHQLATWSASATLLLLSLLVWGAHGRLTRAKGVRR